MKTKIRIFVEGKADKKFLKDFISFLFTGDPNEIEIIDIGGWTEIRKVEPKFKENSNDGGINLLIVDADEKPDQRKKQIMVYKDELDIEFRLFLLPNNKDAGTLETLLCKIINPDHQFIFDCFEKYHNCLSKKPEYHLPNLKSKIYAYLEALLSSKSEIIKDSKRNYKNAEHWDLNNNYLNPLKEFLSPDEYDFFTI